MQVHKSKIFKTDTNALILYINDIIDDGDVKFIDVTGRKETIRAYHKLLVWSGDVLSAAVYSLPSKKHYLKVIINA